MTKIRSSERRGLSGFPSGRERLGCFNVIKLGWFAVSAAVAALILFGVLLLAANLYVQSLGAQQRIRQTLVDALHVPVSLKKTTLTPWEGLRLDGIVLRAVPAADSGSEAAGAFMTVDSFRVRIALWPLLTTHRVLIKSVLLDHPRLAWAQNADGRWVWPGDPALKHRHEAAALPTERLPEPSTPLSTADGSPGLPIAPMPTASPQHRVPPLVQSAPVFAAEAAHLPKFRVRHGALDLLTGRHNLVGRLQEVNLDGQLRDDGHLEGDLRCERAALARPALRLTNFHSAFLFDEAQGLSIDGGKGELAGGELRTNYKLSTQTPGSPFSAECRVNNVDLSELLEQAGSQLHLMEGRLQGGVQMEGSSDDPGNRHATGQLRLIGAEVKNFPILELLGEMLRIKDLSHLQFKKAELDCRLDGEELQIAPLSLISNDLQIQAQGSYATDKDELDLHGRLTIDPAIGRQLPRFMELNFTSCGENEPGCRYIEFDVTGPLSKPSTNLYERVIAGPASGLLQNLLAPKPKKLRNKVPRPSDGQTPAPLPTGPAGS